MKRGKKLALLFAILFLVGSLYSLVSLLAPDENAAEEETPAQVLATLDTAAINRIEWRFDEEDAALVRTDEAWQDSQDESFPLDQSFATAMLNAVATLSANVTITDVKDLSQYGLAEPACTVKLTAKDGTETKLALGDENSLTGDYYVLYNDSADVYTMDAALYTAFAHRRLDLVEKETWPDLSGIQMMQVETGDAKKTMTYVEDSSALAYSGTYNWFWTQEDGSQAALDTTKVTTLTDHLTDLVWDACVDYAMEDPAVYGLDHPTVTVKVNYQEVVTTETGETDDEGNAVTETKTYDQNVTLLIGNVSGDTHFAALEGSKMVYTIDSSVASALMAAEYVTLRPDDICVMEWDTVDSMELRINGKDHVIYRFNEDDGVRYSLDTRAMDAESVETFLDGLTGLTMSGEADTAKSLPSQIVITFHRNTEHFTTMVLSLAKYDEDNYLVTFNGESRLLVAVKDVDALLEAFDAIHETTTTTAETTAAEE